MEATNTGLKVPKCNVLRVMTESWLGELAPDGMLSNNTLMVIFLPGTKWKMFGLSICLSVKESVGDECKRLKD